MYDQIPLGQLEVDPPPSLIATPTPLPAASGQMNEVPTAEAAANELRDIPRKRQTRSARKGDNGLEIGCWMLREFPLKKDPTAPQHHDILRFYVVHKNYENLLVSETLSKLWEYTLEMMAVKMELDGETVGGINRKNGQFIVFSGYSRIFAEKVRAKKNAQMSEWIWGHLDGLKWFFIRLNIWLKHAENLFRTNGTRFKWGNWTFSIKN
jgi:hypothetical protein